MQISGFKSTPASTLDGFLSIFPWMVDSCYLQVESAMRIHDIGDLFQSDVCIQK